MPLARHDLAVAVNRFYQVVSTHMPLARHDVTLASGSQLHMFLLTCLLRGMTTLGYSFRCYHSVSTHMPLARHDICYRRFCERDAVSTHMPLARHDNLSIWGNQCMRRFYSHASCEA